MNKSTVISHGSLGLARQELDETLRLAGEALEAYSRDPGDPVQLQLCGDRLQQASDILERLDLAGGAMLAEELGQVVAALQERRVPQAGEVVQTLLQAIPQLGEYLERVLHGGQDIPIALLPLLNDLRAGRGAPLLTDHGLFSPDLEAGASRPDRPPPNGERLEDVARRLRGRYQLALLGVLRGQDVAESLAQMLEVLTQLDAADAGQSGNLWWIAAGLVEGLQADAVEGVGAIKALLGQIDRQLRRVIAGGPAALADQASRELTRNLLYYVARAEARGERVTAIQAHYRLKELLVEQQLGVGIRDLAGPAAAIRQRVARVLMKDLATVRDGVDRLAASGVAEQDRLLPLQDRLNRIGDTLGVLGLGVPRRLIRDLAARIRALTAGGAVADQVEPNRISEALADVEAAIEALAAGAAVAELLPQLPESGSREVLLEAIDGLDRVKTAILGFAETGSTDGLADIQPRLAGLAEALNGLDMAHVADLLAATGAYAAARLIPGGQRPAAAELDGLVDALAAIEYYLEAARDGRPRPESVLELAVAALTGLGFLPGAGARPPGEQGAVSEPTAGAAATVSAEHRPHIDYDAPVMSDAADGDILEIFIEETGEILEGLRAEFPRWHSEPDNDAALATLRRMFHTLKGSSRLAGALLLGELAWSVEHLLNRVLDKAVAAGPAVFEVVEQAIQVLPGLIGQIQGDPAPEADVPAIMRRAAALAEPEVAAATVAEETATTEPEHALSAAGHGESEPLPQPEDQAYPPIAELAPPEDSGEQLPESEQESEQESRSADADLVELFLEEAAVLLDALEAGIASWQAEPGSSELRAELRRILHTLKGGARLAGFPAMAELSHALETLLAAVQEGTAAPSGALFQLLEQAYDRLHQLRGQAAEGQPMAPVVDLLAAIAELGEAAEAAEPEPEPSADTPPAAEVGPGGPLSALHETAAAPAVLSTEPARPGSQEPTGRSSLVRVRAELLDNLVSLAGEAGIYRTRLEQQVGALRFNLDELEQTVVRLREQLRTLEAEIEAGIPCRGEAGAEGFDPQEADRGSRQQELSWALAESASDLVSIQKLLDRLVRESETLLQQQSRVDTELQDGLLRTRMVPFAHLVPRLRRLVRQTCQELGKQAQLKVLGAQEEMDRTALERITAPLEHMLRNAVVHGIEDPQRRQEAGKPAAGTISVSLVREGADVVIRVSDDGGGIKLDAVRRQAIAQGLMAADAELSDREVMQFILAAGLSTAETVTQIAGRGVGLDVATAEIKQLGGILDIDSEAGGGTTFTIRFPFTLAVNQALFCQIGEAVYAIPLASVVGVVRMQHEELQRCYASSHAAYCEYAGERYQLRALSSLLATGEPQLPGPGNQAPVILVRVGDERLAVHVEALLGNREIVVKSVGAQLSTVPGIYGATVLADGRVVLILDIGSLADAEPAATAAAPPSLPAAAAGADPARKPTVLVVDDSITMRKAATRLLERNGMTVVTVKDGVEAVAQLQEKVPDAVLLDIEMPRMDGYELAAYMRNEERLRSVPIIVVSSRAGAKHRQQALEIGVDRYLGKPYQEAELLGNLRAVLEAAGSGG